MFRAGQEKMRIFVSDYLAPDRIVRDEIMRFDKFTHSDGFTLVELLVVLAVLALATTLVILALPGESVILRNETGRLAAHIVVLRDAAVIEGRPAAVWITPTGYGFERRTRTGWQAMPGRAFAPHDWPPGVSVSLSDERSDARSYGRIAFASVGTPNQSVTINLSGDTDRFTIAIGSSGQVSVNE